jgi:hypothetical protein
MKLTTRREPAELVLWPTLVELLVLGLLDGLAMPALVLALLDGGVGPDGVPEAGVPDPEPAPGLGVVEVAGAVPAFELEADAGVLEVDVPLALEEPVTPAGAVVGGVGAVFEPVALGALAAGGVAGEVRFCGEYMSGSSSMVIGVAPAACRRAATPAVLEPGRRPGAPAWLMPGVRATAAPAGMIGAPPSSSAIALGTEAGFRVAGATRAWREE